MLNSGIAAPHTPLQLWQQCVACAIAVTKTLAITASTAVTHLLQYYCKHEHYNIVPSVMTPIRATPAFLMCALGCTKHCPHRSADGGKMYLVGTFSASVSSVVCVYTLHNITTAATTVAAAAATIVVVAVVEFSSCGSSCKHRRQRLCTVHDVCIL
jgi:hypothetical protein